MKWKRLAAWGCFTLFSVTTCVYAQSADPLDLEARCQAAEAVACNNLGAALEHGSNGFEQDKTAAIKAYEKACDLEEPYSCSNVAIMTHEGRGVDPDPAKALPWAKRGCNGGDPKGCDWAAKILRDADLQANALEVANLSRRGCEMDHASSCIWWGIALEDGTGVVQDKHAAIANYAKACDLDEGIGCYNAALTYKDNQNAFLGSDRFQNSASFAQRGCELRHAGACNTLGYALDIGRGVERDQAQARAVFEDTCAWDSGLGCYNLSQLLREGTGGPRDRGYAQELRRKACTLGYEKAC